MLNVSNIPNIIKPITINNNSITRNEINKSILYLFSNILDMQNDNKSDNVRNIIIPAIIKNVIINKFK